jgi:hypothetical protein
MSCIPDIQTTNEMYNLYLKGYSISKVGKAFQVSRQTVFQRFKRAGMQLRSKALLPFMVFNGKKYTLRNNGYLACTDGVRSSMHRDVWCFHNGEMPENYDIHHINGDKTDNRLENLQILPKSEHTKLHGFRGNQHTKNRNK